MIFNDLTGEEMTALIASNIFEIQSKDNMCDKYKNICSYSQSEIFKNRIIERCIDLIDNEGFDDIFTALGKIEGELNNG